MSVYPLPVTGEFRYLLLVPSEIKLRSDLRLNLLAAGLHHPRLAEKIAAVCVCTTLNVQNQLTVSITVFNYSVSCLL